MLHPYVASVLVGGITFLLVFRVTQSYGRYWEATGAVYKMMSKWMDACIHISVYHLQNKQYDKIRPPKYSKHHTLNAKRLTRDRERIRASRQVVGLEGKISNRRAQMKSIFAVKVDEKRDGSVESAPTDDSEIGAIPVSAIQGMSMRRLKIAKRISSRRFESARHFQADVLKPSGPTNDESMPTDINIPPEFLTGPPKTDGNWGNLFDDAKSTFVNPINPSKTERDFFASIQGGRTPILFLQELAHLTSLLNAVALSTLRNDDEELASPVSLYIPGNPWPAVDPKLDEYLYDSKLEASFYAIYYFLGHGLRPTERAKYNVARPLPVLGGVSEAEIQMLQLARGPLAKTQLCFAWLSEFSVREYERPSDGLLARAMQFISDGMTSYNECRKIMFNPFPFSTFITFGSALSFFRVMGLTSIDEVAKELENQFSNIPNGLPLVTYQAEFNEALITMYGGFHLDAFWNPLQNHNSSSRHPHKSSSGTEQKRRHGGAIPTMPTIYGSHSSLDSTERSGSDDVEDQSKLKKQLYSIVKQQNQMIEQQMNELRQLNKMLEEMFD